MAKEHKAQLVASIPVPATKQTHKQQVFERKREKDGAKSEALNLTAPSDSKKKLQILILDAFKTKRHHMSIRLPYKTSSFTLLVRTSKKDGM